ncbi:MAG: hypothetical protein HFG90_01980 [Acholeplasmatales bacterium]|jgi:hypothetical protein|nr:hypothetical protein [Acholeplasmatales bacterium]
MPADYLTPEEQESYEQVITLINKYVYIDEYQKKIIEALDELVDVLTKGDL